MYSGLPETYYVGHKGTVCKVATGLGGHATAVISAQPTDASARAGDGPSSTQTTTTYEVSVWLNRFGMVCVGCEQFELPVARGGGDDPHAPVASSSVAGIDIVWHPMGTYVVAMVHGEVVFIQLYWLDKKSRAKITARDAAVRNALGEAASQAPSIENHVLVRLLEQNRHTLGATSLSLGDGGRWLLVGTGRGAAYKVNNNRAEGCLAHPSPPCHLLPPTALPPSLSRRSPGGAPSPPACPSPRRPRTQCSRPGRRRLRLI